MSRAPLEGLSNHRYMSRAIANLPKGCHESSRGKARRARREPDQPGLRALVLFTAGRMRWTPVKGRAGSNPFAPRPIFRVRHDFFGISATRRIEVDRVSI